MQACGLRQSGSITDSFDFPPKEELSNGDCADRSSVVSSGRVADLAIQPGLGLLPERWTWFDPHGSAGAVLIGPLIILCYGREEDGLEPVPAGRVEASEVK
jgi:hypothetical protein